MDSLAQKKLTTKRGFEYNYYTSPPTDSKLPTILLCHGWPDSATVWSDLIVNHLVPAGYGVIAPDCLGYAGTSKPTDEQAYAIDLLVADVCEILDEEKVDKVVSLGHDWGSLLAQRLYLFAPERVLSMVLMNVAYRPPSPEPFDLEKFNPLMVKILGYSPYWYWELVLSAEGPKMLEDHLESLWTILHGSNENMLHTFGAKDGMKAFLLEDRRQPVQEYATEERKEEFIKQFKRDGMTAPLCWYKSQADNVHFEVEKTVPKDRYVVNVPVLFIGGKGDRVGLTSGIYQSQKAGVLPNLTVKEVDAGHWIMLAKPKEVGEIVTGWLEDTGRD